jgi:basic amino acid/polyamine antiporter, APA family
VIVIILCLALFFPITTLAQITSFVMLIVYFFVNLALIFIKFKSPKPKKPAITFPIVFPVIGIITTLLLLFFRTIMWAKF